MGGLFTSFLLNAGLCIMYRAHVQVWWGVAAAGLKAEHVLALVAHILQLRAEHMPGNVGFPSQSEYSPY